MRRGKTIVYEVGDSLYVNVTNRCSNRCEFCIRNNGEGAYGSDTLWLECEPELSEIVDAVLAKDLAGYHELVFCGYGEPSYRIEDCRKVALLAKEKYPDIKVRINTNGHSSLIHGNDTAPLFQDAFDTVSISLNAPTAERYVQMCRPIFNAEGFRGMLNFAKNVKKYVHSVLLSVVKETLSDKELEECYRIAKECGAELKVRTYIKPE